MLVAAGETLLIGAALYVFLRGWRRDLGVPLHFATDGLFYLMQSKSTVDNGWWWFNPMLGAPFGLDELAFPANSNVDQAIVWMVSRFVGNAVAATNLAWAFMIVLSGLATTWCLRLFEVSRPSAIVAGVLFAMSPYALYRNTAHFGMVIYLVPCASAVALQLISARTPERGYFRGTGAVLLGAFALISFNYVYYAFFAGFVILMGTIVGFLTQRSRRILRYGLICLGVLVTGTALNLAPSLYSWSRHGKPLIFEDKAPSHAERFGLKIRTLVSPAVPHPFPPFRRWNEKEVAAQFPLEETENWNARLGLVGSIGFLGLLGLLMVPSAAQHLPAASVLLGASRLTIGAVLLATIGGFGSLFSLLITPDIRAYARIYPFIAFFSLAAVAFAVDALFRSGRVRIAACAVIVSIGLLDQGAAAAPMNAEYADNAAQLASLGSFVRTLEDRLPDQAMVLQLPFRTYLNFSTIARMLPYEHFKLYLVSQRLRWSYPALSNQQVAWQGGAARLDPVKLPVHAAREGFAAVMIDRYGYEDGGAVAVAAVRTALRGGGDVIAETDRYIAFDIRPLADAPENAPTPEPSAPATLGLSACAGPPMIAVDQLDARPVTPGQPLQVSGSRELKIVGWAVDPQARTLAAAIDLVIDGTPTVAIYGIDRGDVSAARGVPAYAQSGYLAAVAAGMLDDGPHTLSVRAVAANRECYYQGPDIAIVVD